MVHLGYMNNTSIGSTTKTATVKLRLDEQKKNKLKEIASRDDRSMSYVIEQAIDDRIALEEFQIKGIEEAMAELDRGEFVPHEEVKVWVESLGTENELPQPQPKRKS